MYLIPPTRWYLSNKIQDITSHRTLKFTLFFMLCYRRKLEDLLVAIKDIGLEADTVKSKHIRTGIYRNE